MKSKKGVVEVQFNWILVLVIGGVILLFFSTVILKLKSSSEERGHLAILKSTKSIMIGSESSAGTTNVLTLPESELEINCNEITAGKQTQRFQNMMLFAPRKLETQRLVVKTLAWHVPFRVTNFVYLTSPQIQYAFVGTGDLKDDMVDLMPTELDLFTTDTDTGLSSATLDRDEPIRIVFFSDRTTTQVNTLLNDFSHPESSALVIKPETVRFHNKVGSPQEVQWVFNEMLFGAIISNHPSTYSCVARNAVKKVSVVASILGQRAQNLATVYTGTECPAHYSTAITTLNSVKQTADSYVANPTSSLASLRNAPTNLLTPYNTLLEKSCAELY